MEKIRQNCWDMKKCGRELAGERADEFGVCLAALPNKYYDGVNGGKHCGRFCWAIEDTFCDEMVTMNLKNKFFTCLDCDFLIGVNED
ncbi:MAG: two-CW domain-containing protein, partial [Terrimicrobiaceae bacterium]